MSGRACLQYRPSGVEWLGEIPEHWEIRRLKNVTRFGYGDSLAADDRVPGKYEVYGSNGVVGQHDKANTKAPCLIVGPKGSYGKVAYSEKPCFAIDTTYYIDERLTRSHLRWLYYCLQWLRLDSFTKDSAVPGLAREDAYENVVPFCSIDEQRAIADFLDRETARIDALIGKKQRQIELLQEKRAALISHTVTKGLDPNAKMKDSGIEWLGEIPAHWQMMKLGHAAVSLQTGPFGSQLHATDYVDDGIPVINPSNLQDGEIIPDLRCTVLPEMFAQLARHRLVEDDIVFARRGEMGRCARVTKASEGFLCGTGSLRVRLNTEKTNPQYISLFLSTRGVHDHLLLESVGSTMDNLNTSILARTPVAVPPREEQSSIAEYVGVQTQCIRALITTVLQSIGMLREYRTTVISAAVTGKIDAREVEQCPWPITTAVNASS